MNSTSQPESKAPARRSRWRWLKISVLVLLLAAGLAGAWCRWVWVQVDRYAAIDEAAPADAIVVFGAAEYDGRPSPVFRARLFMCAGSPR